MTRVRGRRLVAIGSILALSFLAVGGGDRPAVAGPAGTAAAPTTDPTEVEGDAWTGTWATGLTATNGVFPARPDDQSIRMIVRTSIGGRAFRVRLSNRQGDRDLTIGAATVGRPAVMSEPDLDPTTIAGLTFDGRRSVTIPSGSDVVSDPVWRPVPPLSQLAVTIYLPEPTGELSFHLFAQQDTFLYDGDHTAEPSGDGFTAVQNHFYFLAGIEVVDHSADGAVAVIGDSIADGFGATPGAESRWPDVLAERLARAPRHVADLGVLNIALSGNNVAHDGDEIDTPYVGRKAIDRLEDDLYPHARVRTVIVALGLGDIFSHDESPRVIISRLRELSAELHGRGYRVLFTTLTPGAGTDGGNWDPRREATRHLVNHYIRSGRDSDGVVDADAAVRDPNDPNRLNPAFFGVDQVHPNDAGNRAIAEAVPLHLL